MSNLDTLTKAIGQTDAEAVNRLLAGQAFSTLTDAAKAAEHDWVEWARAAAVLQRWTEAHGIDADVQRKLGYLSCAAEGARIIPTSMRPPLSETVKNFLNVNGLTVD